MPTAKKVAPKNASSKSGSVAKKAKSAKKVAPAKKAVAKTPAAKASTSKANSPKTSASKGDTNKSKVSNKKVAPSKSAAAKKVVSAKKVAAKPQSTKPQSTKPQLATKRQPARPFPAKLQQTTKGDSTTITVTPLEVKVEEVVVEEKRLLLPPPSKPIQSGKKLPTLKPIKAAPTPVNTEGEEPWTTAELKAMKSELEKDLVRLKQELADAISEMDDLISAAGVGAGDDQADAGTKTFEREHEMSLVYNARDMVLQTERALERIGNKTYGRCEECANPIGKSRLQVFPRATLCMVCKQKEERR
jgi:DnaK suppressor protein